jgi:hypothetical protein
VPESIVIVPPAAPLPDALELLDALLPELLAALLAELLAGLLPEVVVEELQAASAATAPQSSAAPSGLEYLFNGPSSQFTAGT